MRIPMSAPSSSDGAAGARALHRPPPHPSFFPIASSEASPGPLCAFEVPTSEPSRSPQPQQQARHHHHHHHRRCAASSSPLSPTSKRKSKYVPRSLVQHHYTDRSREAPSGNGGASRGGISTLFPVKLYRAIDDMERDGLGRLLCWMPHGRAFVVRSHRDFEKAMPKYFGRMKFSSFQRQLNLYGFMRISEGRDKGAYYHEMFLRGRDFLCARIQRIRVKGTGSRSASNPDMEPDFYAMPPIGPIPKEGEKGTSSSPPAPPNPPPLPSETAPPPSGPLDREEGPVVAAAAALSESALRRQHYENWMMRPMLPRLAVSGPDVSRTNKSPPNLFREVSVEDGFHSPAISSCQSSFAVIPIPDSDLDDGFLRDLELLVSNVGDASGDATNAEQQEMKEDEDGSKEDRNNEDSTAEEKGESLVLALGRMATPEPLPLHTISPPPSAVPPPPPLFLPTATMTAMAVRPPAQMESMGGGFPHLPPPSQPHPPQQDSELVDFLKYLFDTSAANTVTVATLEAGGKTTREDNSTTPAKDGTLSAKAPPNATGPRDVAAAFARRERAFARKNLCCNAAA